MHSKASWSSPEKISALRHKVNQKKTVVIHNEPRQAHYLATFCDKAGISYHGESMGVVLLNLLNARLASKRKNIENRREIAEAHGGKCADCGHLHRGRFEVHHKLAVRDGGTNDLDNLVPLCSACHLE